MLMYGLFIFIYGTVFSHEYDTRAMRIHQNENVSRSIEVVNNTAKQRIQNLQNFKSTLIKIWMECSSVLIVVLVLKSARLHVK